MKDLIAFLAAYQPKYAEIVQGYPEAKIEELERALGRPVPLVYRDFLATAAANLGFRVDQVTFDIDEVIELAAYKRATMPAHIYPIAVDDEQPTSDYYLDTSRASYPGDGMVVSSAAGSLSLSEATVPRWSSTPWASRPSSSCSPPTSQGRSLSWPRRSVTRCLDMAPAAHGELHESPDEQTNSAPLQPTAPRWSPPA